MTELEVNGVLLSDAEDSVVVNLGSVTGVDVNGTDVWSRVAVLPDKPTNFTASNNLETHILFEWTIGENTVGCDIYMLPDTLVQANALTGYQWYDAPTELHDYVVVARSNEGAVASAPDTGKLLIQGSVTVEYGGVTDGDAKFVSGDNGSFTFHTPSGVSEVTVCMCGGGGGGARMWPSGAHNHSTGGGNAGQVVGDVVIPVSGDMAFTVGAGAPATPNGPGYEFDDQNGAAGGSTSFGGTPANGGSGGVYASNTSAPFQGNREAVTTCLGTANNGGRDYYESASYEYWSGGGQSSGASDGGLGAYYHGSYHDDNTEGGPGGIGSGGGGNWSDQNVGYGGAGGSGRITISWSI